MSTAIQLDIFNQPTLNIARPYTEALADDAKNSKFSRDQIVDRMNSLADRHGVTLVHGNGKRLTLDIFEKWLNPSETSRVMPIKALAIFCAATGQYSAFGVLAEPLGLRVVGPREQKLLKWAEAKMTVKEQNRVIRKIEGELS